MVFKKNNPGCGTDPDCGCGLCPYCDDGSPQEFEVTFSGISTGSFSLGGDPSDCDCSIFNTTFVLTWSAGDLSNNGVCTWRYFFPTVGPCGGHNVAFGIEPIGGDQYVLEVNLQFFSLGGLVLNWSKTVTGKPKCKTFADLSLAPVIYLATPPCKNHYPDASCLVSAVA